MGEFKRSPSKVWWPIESSDHYTSDSFCSQDSGFSDIEFPQKKITRHAQTPPIQRKKNEKISSVNRNLFTQVKSHVKDVLANQYSYTVPENTAHINAGTADRCFSEKDDKQVFKKINNVASTDLILRKNSLSSDCESELEELFKANLEHTSTPKVNFTKRMIFSKKKMAVKRENFRQLSASFRTVDNPALQQWVKDIEFHYEQECTTTLHSKSIFGDLHQKITVRALSTMKHMQDILFNFDVVEEQYQNLITKKEHTRHPIQSLVNHISNFLETYCEDADLNLPSCTNENNFKLIINYYNYCKSKFSEVLSKEVIFLLEKLESPKSDLDLRATITGITSLCLDKEQLIEVFTKKGIVPILIILCEKCEGSSLRSLFFRALSTTCVSSLAIEQFGKFSGIQVICETLCDKLDKPEPERSEAVALLVQVTAPWRDDSHIIQSLSDYIYKIIKTLTKFIDTTKCCKNILLCTAALANLSEIESKSVEAIINSNTVQILLKTVNQRGPCVSIYLFEQVAALIVNLSSQEAARKHLMSTSIISALLYFLNISKVEGEAEKRLQQKSIIALSRLCSQGEACRQIVELGGVRKLIKMCRNKNERFCSDAVLVATLATLRKIVDVCGNQIMSSEDIQELVAPKLLDSFLAYSSQHESYV